MLPNITLVVSPWICDQPIDWLQQWPNYRYLQRIAKSSTCSKQLTSILALILANTSDVPFAALGALGAGLPAYEGWWLRADPVELLLDMQNIFLLGNQHLQLETEETKQLVADINSLLDPHSHLHIAKNNEWYLQLPVTPKLMSSPLESVIGKNITEYLPTGEDQKQWKMLMTEMQMLLHSHKVNLQRSLSAKPIVNGVWLWGEGKLSEFPRNTSCDQIYSNNNIAKGLANLMQIAFAALPNDLGSIDMIKDRSLIVLDNNIRFEDLVNKWLDPLWRLVLDKKVKTINFYLGDGQTHQVSCRWLGMKKLLYRF